MTDSHRSKCMKAPLLARVATSIGNKVIGDIKEIERRTGVPLRHDFYWPRKMLFLTKAHNLDLVDRLGENEVRRQLTNDTINFCMVVGFILSFVLISGVPSTIIATRTGVRDITSGVKNLSNFSTDCLLGKEDNTSLIECQKSVRTKSNAAQKRIETFLNDKDKLNAAYNLVGFWKQRDAAKREGASEQAVAQLKVSEAQYSKQLTESELSELDSVYSELAGYDKELAVLSAKLKVNFYKDKASKGGLTEQENGDYQAQIAIIKNNK